MSIGKQQIIHIVSEVVIITGISIYFQLKVRHLHNAIEKLENKIEQQDQVIQNHEQLLLRIMNNVDLMNVSLSEMKKYLIDDKKPNPPTSVNKTNKKDKQPKIVPPKNNSNLPPKLPKSVQFQQNFPNQPIFFPNIPTNENIFVMEIKPTVEKTTSYKIEEILEEKNNEDLDKEIEKELEELEKEFIDEDTEKDDDEEDEDEDEEDEEDDDKNEID